MGYLHTFFEVVKDADQGSERHSYDSSVHGAKVLDGMCAAGCFELSPRHLGSLDRLIK